MKMNIVNIKEMANIKKNPTFCISALRYTDNCHKCNYFQNLSNHNGWNLKKTLEKSRCKPFLSIQIVKKIKAREKLLKKIFKLNQKLAKNLSLN